MTNFFGGGGQKTAPTPPATQLRIQTSVQGTPIPIGWGTNRLAPNLIYYNDFRSVQVQQSSGGGKGSGIGGGGKGGGSTTTNYFATVICGLCEGPIQSFSPTSVVWASGNITNLANLNFTSFSGSYGQTPWSFMTANHPADARAFRGIYYVAAAPFALNTSPELPSLNFEVGFGFFEPSGTTIDANPRDIIVDFLTNNKYGLNFPGGRIGDTNLATLYNYCQAVGIWMSPILSTQKSAQSFMQDVLYGCVAEAVWSNGALKVIPYYDASATGHGATFTPNLTPIYDLTDTDFLPGNNSNYASPVIVTIKSVSDIYNSIKIQYLDRNFNYVGAVGSTPDYNPTVVEAKDDASIQQYFLRGRQTKQLDLFCYGPAAQQCAQLQLGREQVVTTYQFELGAKFVLLEPMDLVTLTDSHLGLTRKLVRIKEISENQDYTYTFIAEDMLIGAASPPLYGQQAKTGAVLNTNADPGLTLAPFFFEPTDQLAGGLEVWMAVTGVNLTTWGGCNVFVSYDGVNYQVAGQQLGPTRMGVLTAALKTVTPSTSPPTIDNSTVLSVDLTQSGSQLASATQNDLLGLATLCYVGGEFLAYRDVNPTGANAFNLSTLSRGAYGTSQAAVPAGSTFVRIDAGVFKIPFTQDRIGQTLFIKLVNFNHYGAGPQNLSSVAPYTYTIVGTALTSPLPDVTNFTTNYQSNITLFAWDEIKDFRNPIDYEIRRGVDWPTGQVIGRYLHPNVPALGLTPVPSLYLIKAHCQPLPGLDVYSADASSIAISGAVIPLNIVKSFDEFAAGTGILQGTFAGNVYNNTNIIETFGSGDVYQIGANLYRDVTDVYGVSDVYLVVDFYGIVAYVDDVYSITDIYNFGNIGSGDVYGIADVYQIDNVYTYATTVVVNGTYTIPSGHIVNVGRVVGCLVDASWVAEGIPVGQNIFTWTDVFAHTDIFGSSSNSFILAYPNINLSNDGVTFLGWQRYRAGYYSAMAFNMQMFLQSNDPNTIASVSAFTFAVHIPSRIDHLIGVAVPATVGGLAVTFQPDGAASPAAFNGGPGGVPASPGLPTWQATITNEVSGDLLTVSNLTLSSAQVNVTNAGSPVARTINIEFAGY